MIKNVGFQNRIYNLSDLSISVGDNNLRDLGVFFLTISHFS